MDNRATTVEPAQHPDVADDVTHVPEMTSSPSIERQMLLYGLPIIVTGGTLGNLASVAVLSRQRMRTKSIYFYLLLLSAADTLVLYSSAVKTWVRLATGVEWLHASDAACRSLTFTFLSALHLSAWLVVLTTVDRFVAVWFPLKAHVFCSQTRTRLACLALFVATIIFDGHVFWTFELLPEVRDANGTVIWPEACQPGEGAADFMYGPFEYLKLASYSVTPFVVILTLNASIIVRLRRTSPLLRGRHTMGGRASVTEAMKLTTPGRRRTEQISTATNCYEQRQAGLFVLETQLVQRNRATRKSPEYR